MPGSTDKRVLSGKSPFCEKILSLYPSMPYLKGVSGDDSSFIKPLKSCEESSISEKFTCISLPVS